MSDDEADAAARLLLIIPGFFESAVPVAALWMQQHCQDNEQAKRVAWTACESQSEWKGLPGLMDILREERRQRASTEDERKFERWKAEYVPPECEMCRDWGWRRSAAGQYERCLCPEGAKVSDAFLEKLNGPARVLATALERA